MNSLFATQIQFYLGVTTNGTIVTLIYGLDRTAITSNFNA